jgi:hypothetical protein
MKISIEQIKGNPLRVICYLYRPNTIKVERWAIVKSQVYVQRPPNVKLTIEEDLKYLLLNNVLESVNDKEYRLTECANTKFAEYKRKETELILREIIDVDYEFAVLNYFAKFDDHVLFDNLPQIFLDFVPKMKDGLYPEGNLHYYLFAKKTLHRRIW